MNTRDTGTAGAGDLGYFYILGNDAFNGKWCKVLTTNKPIDPDVEGC